MFFLDLTKKKLELVEYEEDDLDQDLKGLSSTADYKVFNSRDEAESFTRRYTNAMEALEKGDLCASRELPAMLLKRRYLAQVVMGEKNKTIRSYKKNWLPGQLFNFHDQRYFLTVKLDAIEQQNSGLFCYSFSRLSDC